MEALKENDDFISVCEFVPNQLYFVTVRHINNGGSLEVIIPSTDDYHFFHTDHEYVYQNFYSDFGPLSIAYLYRFCKKVTNKLAAYGGDEFYERFMNSRFGKADVTERLRAKFIKKKVLVYYTSTNSEKRANAAFLISSFAVLYLGMSPRMAWKTLKNNSMPYRPFQDASIGYSPYKITIKDCLDALNKASVFGFFNFNDFNVEECVYFQHIEHGDINWIVPQKFLAFPGPVDGKNFYYHHPKFYVEYFLSNNVTDIVRLNQRAYDAKGFTKFGLNHHDLYMQDGADPPSHILDKFLDIAEKSMGAIAVHCKAGLGRTGTLIAAYLIKHYRMGSREAIAWTRICRPGSVIGHQQEWLEMREEWLWLQGNRWRMKRYGKTEIVPFLPYGLYSFDAPRRELPGLHEYLFPPLKKTKNRSKGKKGRLGKLDSILRNSYIIDKNQKSEPRAEPLVDNSLTSPDEGKIKPLSTVVPEKPNLPKSPSDLDEETLRTIQYQNYMGANTSTYSYPNQQTAGFPYTLQNSNYVAQNHVDLGAQTSNYMTQDLNYGAQSSNYNPQPNLNYSAQNSTYSAPHSDYAKYPTPSSNYSAQISDFAHQNSNAASNYWSPSTYGNIPNPYSGYGNPNMMQHNMAHSSYNNTYIPLGVPRNASQKVNYVYPKTETRIPKSYSFGYQKRPVSRSIDRNWKREQNTCFTSETGKYGEPVKRMFEKPSSKSRADEPSCEFDQRDNNISQYSGFNKSYLKNNILGDTYLKELEKVTELAKQYKNNAKKKQGHKSKDGSGLLISPEDVQSWMEDLAKKNPGKNLTQGDRLNAIKRSKLVK